jgi:hypothetical protein
VLREDQLAVYPLSIVLPLDTWTYQSLIVFERTAMLLSPQYAVPLSEPYAKAEPGVNATNMHATVRSAKDLRIISNLLPWMVPLPFQELRQPGTAATTAYA